MVMTSVTGGDGPDGCAEFIDFVDFFIFDVKLRDEERCRTG